MSQLIVAFTLLILLSSGCSNFSLDSLLGEKLDINENQSTNIVQETLPETILPDYELMKNAKPEQEFKVNPPAYPEVCKNGYIKIGNECLTYSKICQIRFGNNSYGESVNGPSKTRTSNIIPPNVACYCKKGYIYQFGGDDCVLSTYEDNIAITGDEYLVDSYDLSYNEFDNDADGILNNYDNHPNGGGDVYIKKYTLNEQCRKTLYADDKPCDQDLTVILKIPSDYYDYYKYYNNHVFLEDFSNLNSFVIYQDPTIIQALNQIYELAQKTGITSSLLAKWLVNEVVYTPDINTGWDEYPKYPIETIIDGKGDCEDTAYLMASLLKGLNYDVVLVEFINHVAVAVVVNKYFYDIYMQDILDKDYMWRYNANVNDDKYLLYIETTADNSRVGYMPEELWNADYRIIEIN